MRRRRRRSRIGNSGCRSRTLYTRVKGRLVISEHNQISRIPQSKQRIAKQRKKRKVLGKKNYNNLELDWLADTGSPSSFMQYSKAQ